MTIANFPLDSRNKVGSVMVGVLAFARYETMHTTAVSGSGVCCARPDIPRTDELGVFHPADGGVC